MKAFPILIALLLLTATGFAQNGNESNNENGAIIVELPVFAIFENDCCDEMVSVEAVARIVLRDGFQLNNSHLTLKGSTGTGSSGRSYTQKGASTQNISVQDDGSATATFNIKMVSTDGCSFSIRLVQKINMTANGDVTVEFEKYTITCDDEE